MQITSATYQHIKNATLDNKSAGADAFVIKLKAHNLDAFKTLYKLYAASLLGSIIRNVGNEKKAELILEKTFIEVWNTIYAFDEKKCNLFTWMNQIARRLMN